MNSLREYFTSPTKSVSTVENKTIQSSESKINIPTSVNKTTKTDGRKIIKNMEEVLNSVKRKHKNKHKHRHHHCKKDINTQKLQKPIETTDTANVLSEHEEKNIEQYSPSKENILIHNKKNKKAKKLNKLASKKTNNNRIDSKLIVQTFQPTSKKHTAPLSVVNEVLLKSEENVVIEICTDIDEKTLLEINEIVVPQQQTKKNAFEFMMNSRNKSIGRNSPGKTEICVDNIDDENKKRGKTKRKLFLEEWAEQKGAKKRKLDDETRKEYVEHVLTKRAKRLKKMIVNCNANTKISPKKQLKNKISKISKINKSSPPSENPKREKRKRTLSVLSEPDKSDKAIVKQEEDFVSKLSSPIKKRDSLLGYFPKAISPKTERKTENESNKCENGIIEDLDVCTLKTRPRRSCVGKNRYDYDLDESPKKLKNNTAESKPKKTVKLKEVAKHEDSDVVCLENNSKNSKSEEVPKKIAPLFLKAMPKPNIDPQVLKARQEFLMSGVPEKMKQEIAKQKQFEETFEASIEIFPKICHVPEWETDYVKTIQWEDIGVVWMKEEIPDKLSAHLQHKSKQYSSIFKSINNCPSSSDLTLKKTHLLSLNSLPLLKNKINLIKDWKKLYDKFPTYKCYNQLREKYRYFSAMDTALDTQQIAESFVVTKLTRNKHLQNLNKNGGDNDELPPDSAPNGELLFTEKYKPMSSEQMLVNLIPVNTLKEFLSSWQDDRRNQRLNDSMVDFEYNNDSNSSLFGSNTSNAIVLLGPYSSGKTQAVFALADELNFNVLEINAGMKRTGKKLLQELQEATQSHQIRKDSKDNLFKKSLNGKNSKKLDINLDSSSSSESITNEKMSLILVEDADITFDQYDAGYVDAIYQLASISKRPVVIIANNRNCPHLLRLINLNSIEFSSPNPLNISKFLTVLSLIENCPIDLDEIISLYLFNNMDLRKTILEMQFFIQSGGDRLKSEIIKNTKTTKTNEKYYASPTKRRLSSESYKGNDECILKDDENIDNNKIYIHNTLFELFTRSQNFNPLIPFPVNLNLLWTNLNSIFHISKKLIIHKQISPKRKSLQRKITNKNGLNGEVHVLNTLAEFYDNISVASSLSFKEIDDRLTLNIEEEISHLLIENSIKSILETEHCSYNLFVENPKKRTNLTPSTANSSYKSKSKFLDYEACLRAICRSEKTRSSLERRGTRFYHYLRNSCTKIDTFSTEMYDEACSILTDYI